MPRGLLIQTHLVLLASLLLVTPALAQSPADGAMPEREREDNYQEALDLGLERLREGDYTVALRAFRFCSKLYPKRPSPYYNCACVRAREGKKGEALAYLEESLERGFRDFGELSRDSDFAPLRADKRFQTLVKKYRARLLKGLFVRHLPAKRRRNATLIVFLHGDGQGPEDYAELFADRPDDVGYLLPRGSERRGRGWSFTTAAETRVLHALETLLAKESYDPKRVALGGFSIGAYRALNIALNNPTKVRGVVAHSPYYDAPRMGPLLANAARQGLRIFLSVGRSDALRSGVREGRDAFVTAGIPVVFHRFDGGHRLPDNPRKVFADGIAWVVDRRRPATKPPRGF